MSGPDGRTPFAGRQRELVTLLGRLEEARSGKGGVVLIAGEPGVGKTRLVQELAEQAFAEERRVLFSRAYDAESAPPYLPLAEALTAYVQTLPEAELLDQLADGAADVALIVPEILKRLPDLATRPAIGAGEDRHRLFESVSTFLLNIARSAPLGLLLILDDLHWTDHSTSRLAVHLARKLGGVPLVLVTTYRTVELKRTSPLMETLGDLAREAVCEHISLGPLSREETAALVECTWGPAAPAAVDALYGKTEGNPFFVREVIRHLQAEGGGLDAFQAGLAELQVPEGVRQVIGKRLSRLSPAANRVLEACAILGDGVSFDVLAAVCGGDETVLLEALGDAVDAGMLREEGENYHLSHALIRQAISDRLLAPRKQRLHLRAAEAIEQIQSDNLDPFLDSLALHYRLAGASAGFEKALDYTERASAAASSVFAYEEAVRHLETALELLDGRRADSWIERRAGLLTRLGALLFESGLDWTRGVACLDDAVSIYERLGRANDAAFVHARLGHYRSGYVETADLPRALDHLRAAEAVLGPQPPGVAQGRLYHALAVAANAGARTAEGLAASQRVLQIAAALSNPELHARGAHIRGLHLLASGAIAAGLAQLEEARESADRQDLIYVLYLHASNGGLALITLGAPKEAQRLIRRGLTGLERAHAPRGLRANALERLGEAHIAAGELAEARRLLELLDPERTGLLSAPLAASIALCDGDWATAEALAGRNREQCRRSGHRRAEWYALAVIVRSRSAQGDLEEAEALLRDALAIGVSGGRLPFELSNRADLAILAAKGRSPDEAESHLFRCRAILSNGEDWRGLAGRTALAEAAALGFAGRLGEAEPRFVQALETFGRYSLRWDEAETQQLWAAALEAAGERAWADEKLARARAVYEGMHAGSPWLEAISATAHPLAHGRRAQPRYPDALTAREVDVLRLLAAGESNREIAMRLVLSPRTAERHVASIYRKIGARRRADAISYALLHGLIRAPAPSRE